MFPTPMVDIDSDIVPIQGKIDSNSIYFIPRGTLIGIANYHTCDLQQNITLT